MKEHADAVVIVTERTEKIFTYTTGRNRQNFNGRFMLGASKEDVGYDLDSTHEVLKSIAVRAIKIFPVLKNTADSELGLPSYT